MITVGIVPLFFQNYNLILFLISKNIKALCFRHLHVSYLNTVFLWFCYIFRHDCHSPCFDSKVMYAWARNAAPLELPEGIRSLQINYGYYYHGTEVHGLCDSLRFVARVVFCWTFIYNQYLINVLWLSLSGEATEYVAWCK